MDETTAILTPALWKQIALDVLKRDGICKMPPLSSEQNSAILKSLLYKPVFNAHVVAKSTDGSIILNRALIDGKWPMMCHKMEDIVAAPWFFEVALSMYDLVHNYFGEKPYLYSMNCFWTQPAEGPEYYADTHWWHRDGDDRKQFTMFLYGMDVLNTGDGAHMYQKGTHLIPDHALGRDYQKPDIEKLEVILGPAGSLFLSDTGGLHMGLRPKKPRMLAWARWGVSNPPWIYSHDRLSPVSRDILGDRYPKTPELQEAVHLVVC